MCVAAVEDLHTLGVFFGLLKASIICDLMKCTAHYC